MVFEWDEDKNNSNFKKHGVTFEEAITVFKDFNAVLVYDEDNLTEKVRFNIIGMSQLSRILIVCHCYRNEDMAIRIISGPQAYKD
jgi:uncharacterized DUF497 family protein